MSIDSNADTGENLAQTILANLRTPMVLIPEGQMPAHQSLVAVPNNFKTEVLDTEKNQPAPRRKLARVSVSELESFIDYLTRHGKPDQTTIWTEVDYPKGRIAFTGIINDNGCESDHSAWRDHLVSFSPAFSEEWKTWTEKDHKAMSQVEFATFLEDNLKDIASADGMPTGTQMYEMATNLQMTFDNSIKSQVRTQSGGVRLEFVDAENQETVTKMDVFRQFALGLKVFRNGAGYQVNARLRYRKQEGRLLFWYELIRPDLTMEDASKDLIASLREQIDFPFFYGNPFNR